MNFDNFNEFKNQFSANLRAAGNALEENNYEVDSYNARFKDASEKRLYYRGDWTPEPSTAFDSLINKLAERKHLKLEIPTSDILNNSPEDDLTTQHPLRNIEGEISLDEPEVEVNDMTLPAFSLHIDYYQHPEPQYKVHASDINPPYTLRDGLEETESITQILQQQGLPAERGRVNGYIGEEGVPDELR